MLTTIIKTKNSEDVIAQTLESVKDLGNIIVLDEHSNDDTILIAKEYKAQIVYFSSLEFNDTFNQALSDIESDWVLYLQGDEIIPEKLGREILNYIEKPKKNKYAIYLAQKLFYLDKEIKADRKFVLKLFKKDNVKFNNYALIPNGTKKYKLDFDFKQDKNCVLKFEKKDIFNIFKNSIEETLIKTKGLEQKKASIFIKPIITFLYFYILKKAFFDGKRGLIYSYIKAFRIFLFECSKFEKINL